MDTDYHRAGAGINAHQPTFDTVARGYDQRQVDEYLATLWRYASQLTQRVAAAEAALNSERRRDHSQPPDPVATQAGGRIGLMLAMAQQEADEIITGARTIAERALEEAIEDAAANHPIVRSAREQADKLLMEAAEDARHRARHRYDDIELQIARASGILEGLRHQQGEVLGALLRLRGLISSSDIDRAVTELARAGTTADGAPTGHADPATPAGTYAYTPAPPAEECAANEYPAHDRPADGVGPTGPDAGVFARSPTPGTGWPGYRREDDIIDAEVVEE
jgi:DivIVA domain-containing protein